MSQIDLAEAIGVSRGQLIKYESGENRQNLDALWRIADALGVETQSLIPERMKP